MTSGREPIGCIESAASKKVLFVGESIKDIYYYGRLIGRPPKEPIICVELQGRESFEGGVMAAAEHAKPFVKNVEVFSTRKLIKERYVDGNRYRKLFEVYSGDIKWDEEMPDLSDYDMVVVLDYGHGMMTPELIDRICVDSKFLAVNAQTNSSNFGFNLATKYHRADYLCMDELEARLSTGNQHGPLEASLEKLHAIAPKVIVTQGKLGATGISREGMFHSPSVTKRVVDTMGAGDAFFAVTACIAAEAGMPELLDIGNAAGALKAQSVGQKPITKNELFGYLNR